MPSNTQLVEIDLRSGIVTNESLYAIGPRLWRATDTVWNYPYPHAVAQPTTGFYGGPWFLRQPLVFPYKAPVAITDCDSIRDFCCGVTNLSGAIAVLGANGSNQYGVWSINGGAEVPFDTTATRLTISSSTRAVGSSVVWANPGYHPRTATVGPISLTFNNGAKTIVRGSGSFLTDGFRDGDTVTVTGTVNNNKTFKVATAADLTLTTTGDVVPTTETHNGTVTLDALLPSTTTIFLFAHKKMGQIYYMLSTDTAVFSYTNDVTNAPAGASAMCIHLDRLWIASSSSYLYFTDPFNVNSIRANNVISLGGAIPECLVPGQLGAIDSSGIPHLIIGCRGGVFVLDGDPQLGNAALRTLSTEVGMPNPNAAVTTPYGVFFLGTDGNLWQIPPGAAEVRPVGEGIRNVLGVGFFADIDINDLDIADSIGALAWFDPYIYHFISGAPNNGLIFKPSRDGIAETWGPVTFDFRFNPVIMKSAPVSSTYAPSGKDTASLIAVSQDPGDGLLTSRIDQWTQPAGTYPNGSSVARSSIIETGFINMHGHRVQPMRIILETTRLPQVSNANVVWTVLLYDEKGTQYTARATPEPTPTGGARGSEIIRIQHFIVNNMPACRAFRLKILCTSTSDLGLLRLGVRVHTTPAEA